MAQTTYDNVSAGEYARQHNGNVTNNYRYNYGLRTRRSDETLREDQRNVLLLRAAAEGQLPRMQHLFRLGVDIDFSDDDGFMALHHAVLSGFEDCVQELIDRGSDVNAMTQHGVPLNLAAQKERGRVISILVDARADRNRAVAFAVAHGQDVENLRSLLNVPVLEEREGALNLSYAGDQDSAEGDQLSVPTTVLQGREGPQIGARLSDKVEHVHSPLDGGSATIKKGSQDPDKGYRYAPQRDDGNGSGEETFKGGEVKSKQRTTPAKGSSRNALDYPPWQSDDTGRTPIEYARKSLETSKYIPEVTSEQRSSVFKSRQHRLPNQDLEGQNKPRRPRRPLSPYNREARARSRHREYSDQMAPPMAPPHNLYDREARAHSRHREYSDQMAPPMAPPYNSRRGPSVERIGRSIAVDPEQLDTQPEQPSFGHGRYSNRWRRPSDSSLPEHDESVERIMQWQDKPCPQDLY